MLSEFSRCTWHVRRFPCKDVPVLTDELDERAFLFRIHIGTNGELFGRAAYAKFMARPCYVYLQLKMPGHKGTITVHGSRKIALECEEGDPSYAESVCATEELNFYKDNVDPADMTSL